MTPVAPGEKQVKARAIPIEPSPRNTHFMQVDDILRGNEAFIFMERYVDEAVKTYSPFAGLSEVAPQFQQIHGSRTLGRIRLRCVAPHRMRTPVPSRAHLTAHVSTRFD